MLASDYSEDKIRFPVIAQPKIDGVRGLNMTGGFTGRSLKKHANKHVTAQFSLSSFIGMDGEVAAERETHPDLCRITTSALSTIEGSPFVLWWLFDYVTAETKGLPYRKRLECLCNRVQTLRSGLAYPSAMDHLRIVPSVTCDTLDQLLECDSQWLDMGYEGTIIRDPEGLHKEGRSTVREGGLLRIKRFMDAEAVVVEILEGDTNLNEAQINELGKTFRSTHQENMVPNGMVGAMMCRLTNDIVDNKGAKLFECGQIIKVGAGSMPHLDRLRFYNNQQLLLEKVIKFKFFPKGRKDKPRFPTYLTIRSDADQGE